MELLFKGGPVMFVLLAVSIVGLALVIWKSALVLQVRADWRRFKEGEGAGGVWEEVLQTLEVRAKSGCRSLDELQAHAAHLASQRLRGVEQGLRELSMLAHISPFLGLLGTVTGMIRAFQQLESAGMRVNPGLLAGGVWEALLTTAFGISIALPLLLAFHLLDGAVDRIRDRLEGLIELESYRLWGEGGGGMKVVAGGHERRSKGSSL